MRIRFLFIPLACYMALFSSLTTRASAQGVLLNVDSQNPIEYVSPEPVDPETPATDVSNSPDPSGIDVTVTDPEQAPSSNSEEVPPAYDFSIISYGAVNTSSSSIIQLPYQPQNAGVVPTGEIITRIDTQIGPPSDYLASIPEPSTMAFGIFGCVFLLARRSPLFSRHL